MKRCELASGGAAVIGNTKLLDAADFVERIPEKQFDIRLLWTDSTTFVVEEVRGIYEEVLPGSDPAMRIDRIDGPCGCAIGHMAMNGGFGFDESALENAEGIFGLVAIMLNIELKDAEHLFDGASYDPLPSPAQVAARMRRVAMRRKGTRLSMRTLTKG